MQSSPALEPAVASLPPIGELLVRALAREPEAVAFIAGERHIRYADCAQAISQAVDRLDGLGLRSGDTVAQLAGNRPEPWFVTAACYLMGLRSVAIPADVGTAAELASFLDFVEARVLVLDGPVGLEARQAVAHGFSHDAGGSLPWFWSAAPATGRLRNRAGPEDIVRLAFTRGSTGPRKGVLLSARALSATALVNLADGEWPAQPKVLCPEPLSGGFGNFVVPTLLRGGTLVLQDGFAAGRFVEALARHRPTVALLFPDSLRRLLPAPHARGVDGCSLQLLVYSGGSLTDEEIGRAHRLFGPVLCQVHGQTECPKAFSLLRRSDHASERAETRRSLGVPCTGMAAAILREDMSECAPGEAGELCVRGPALASGYWRQPGLTAHAFRGGWWHSGDRCRFDERGYLHFVERLPAPSRPL